MKISDEEAKDVAVLAGVSFVAGFVANALVRGVAKLIPSKPKPKLFDDNTPINFDTNEYSLPKDEPEE